MTPVSFWNRVEISHQVLYFHTQSESLSAFSTLIELLISVESLNHLVTFEQKLLYCVRVLIQFYALTENTNELWVFNTLRVSDICFIGVSSLAKWLCWVLSPFLMSEKKRKMTKWICSCPERTMHGFLYLTENTLQPEIRTEYLPKILKAFAFLSSYGMFTSYWGCEQLYLNYLMNNVNFQRLNEIIKSIGICLRKIYICNFNTYLEKFEK